MVYQAKAGGCVEEPICLCKTWQGGALGREVRVMQSTCGSDPVRKVFISPSDRCLHCLESFMKHIYILLLCAFVVSGEDEFALLSRTLATLLRVLSTFASVICCTRLLNDLALSV